MHSPSDFSAEVAEEATELITKTEQLFDDYFVKMEKDDRSVTAYLAAVYATSYALYKMKCIQVMYKTARSKEEEQHVRGVYEAIESSAKKAAQYDVNLRRYNTTIIN